jgi:hypothetical protein
VEIKQFNVCIYNFNLFSSLPNSRCRLSLSSPSSSSGFDDGDTRPWRVACSVWCGVWCVVCGVWCVVCGVWCVVCGVCVGWCACVPTTHFRAGSQRPTAIWPSHRRRIRSGVRLRQVAGCFYLYNRKISILCLYIYIYIYIYKCVYVCVCTTSMNRIRRDPPTGSLWPRLCARLLAVGQRSPRLRSQRPIANPSGWPRSAH